MTVGVGVAPLVVDTVAMVLGLLARLILGRFHEIHRTLTGVVFVAVLVPIPGMSRRDVQVDRLDGRSTNDDWRGLRDHRLRVHDRRCRPVADGNLTVDTWNDLPA